MASLSTRSAALVLAAVLSVGASLAHAEEAASCAATPCRPVRPPLAPEAHPDWWQLHIGVSGIVPFERGTLCPNGHGCVLNAGVGLNATLVSQSAHGLGVFAAYDIWAVDSDSTYEVGLLHALRGGFRYILDDHDRVHPYLAGSVALTAFGDSGSIATVGVALVPGVGAEIELSENASIVGELDGWALTTLAFRSRDGVERASGFGINLYMRLTVGFLVRFGAVAMPDDGT